MEDAELALLNFSEITRVLDERRTWWPYFHFDPQALPQQLPRPLPRGRPAPATLALSDKAACAMFMGTSASYIDAAAALLDADPGEPEMEEQGDADMTDEDEVILMGTSWV